MIPEQARLAADELLEQERQAVTAAKNINARRVPFVYYVRGLNSLEPWERAELLQVASRRVANQWRVAVLAFALVLACCVAWWLLGLFDREGVPPVLLVFVIASVAFLPGTYLVRQEIRRLLAQRPPVHYASPREV